MPLKAGHFSVKIPGQVSVEINNWMAFGLYDLELVAIQIDRIHVKEKLLS